MVLSILPKKKKKEKKRKEKGGYVVLSVISKEIKLREGKEVKKRICRLIYHFKENKRKRRREKKRILSF